MRLIHPEVLFSAAYALVLVLIARFLRWSAERLPQENSAETSWTDGHVISFRVNISRVLFVLAGFILVVAALRFHRPDELVLSTLSGFILFLLS